MSKLTRKLEKLGEDPSLPIGFSTSKTSDQKSAYLMLIKQIDLKDLNGKSSLSKNRIDALIVSVNSHKSSYLTRISELAGDHIWGVKSNSVNSNDLDMIYKSNCDFIVFDPNHTSAEIINNDDIGKIVAVNHRITDETARAINELPIDGVLFSPRETSVPFTVQNLMEIQMIQSLIDKPFILSTSSSIQSQDLESLHKIGISGIVIESSTLKAIQEIRASIEKLPHQKNQSKNKSSFSASAITGLELSIEEDYEEY